jgi:hypothetical protein
LYYIIAQEPTLNDPNLQVETIVEGLSMPTSMAFIDNNNILVLEKERLDLFQMAFCKKSQYWK